LCCAELKKEGLPVLMDLILPNIIFVAGKKKAGKDVVCDSLVPYGYTKLHIAEPWLRRHCADMGISYEGEYLPNKHIYRAEIQRRATLARAADPECLLKELPAFLSRYERVAVSGVRFINEALYGIFHLGALVAKVEVPEAARRQRFLASGESLDLLKDPFEREIDEMPCQVLLQGVMEPATYPLLLSGAYVHLLRAKRNAA
jgi:hypothetical protein